MERLVIFIRNTSRRNVTFVLWALCVEFLLAVLNLIGGKGFRTRRVVGIFSREGDRCYHFLYEALRSQDLLISEVRRHTITNEGWCAFTQEVSGCDLAVLYHSKSRGRVNVTDVTDSIYDQELQLLSTKLGKENVLVIIDDLDSTTPEDKKKILHNQPLIQNRARDLVLFHKDKNASDDQKMADILSHLATTTTPIIISKDSSYEGIAYLVWLYVQLVNFVMGFVFKVFTFLGQTPIKHCDRRVEKEK